jgi:hypothetical protein
VAAALQDKGQQKYKLAGGASCNERALLELPFTISAPDADEVLMQKLQDQLFSTFPNTLKDFANGATGLAAGLEVEACESRRVRKRAVDEKTLRCVRPATTPACMRARAQRQAAQPRPRPAGTRSACACG